MRVFFARLPFTVASGLALISFVSCWPTLTRAYWGAASANPGAYTNKAPDAPSAVYTPPPGKSVGPALPRSGPSPELADSYRKAEAAFRAAAQKCPPRAPCYNAFADYHACLASGASSCPAEPSCSISTPPCGASGVANAQPASAATNAFGSPQAAATNLANVIVNIGAERAAREQATEREQTARLNQAQSLVAKWQELVREYDAVNADEDYGMTRESSATPHCGRAGPILEELSNRQRGVVADMNRRFAIDDEKETAQCVQHRVAAYRAWRAREAQAEDERAAREAVARAQAGARPGPVVLATSLTDPRSIFVADGAVYVLNGHGAAQHILRIGAKGDKQVIATEPDASVELAAIAKHVYFLECVYPSVAGADSTCALKEQVGTETIVRLSGLTNTMYLRAVGDSLYWLSGTPKDASLMKWTAGASAASTVASIGPMPTYGASWDCVAGAAYFNSDQSAGKSGVVRIDLATGQRTTPLRDRVFMSSLVTLPSGFYWEQIGASIGSHGDADVLLTAALDGSHVHPIYQRFDAAVQIAADAENLYLILTPMDPPAGGGRSTGRLVQVPLDGKPATVLAVDLDDPQFPTASGGMVFGVTASTHNADYTVYGADGALWSIQAAR